jgi:photosystem II stability/assembly factor-like uncharacterized protein
MTFFMETVGAQTNNPFHLPPSIPVPEWVKLTNWDRPNVRSIDSLIHALSTDEDQDNKNNAQETEFHEDPYITAYIRWRSKMRPNINSDGTVIFNPEPAKQLLIRSTEKKTPGASQRTTAAGSWTHLGPKQTFRQVTGELADEQNNMYCIAIAPSNPSVLYAASEPGVLYRSSDKGVNWSSVTDAIYSCQASTIAISTTNENTVYAYDGMSNAILKTTDGGTSWHVLSSYTFVGGDRMIISPATGRILITGTSHIYYSDDTGATWTAASGSGAMTDICFNPHNPDTVYASGATSSGYLQLLRSVDGGSSFSDVTGTLGWINTGGSRLAVSKAGSNYVYCANIGGTSAPRIIRSTDRGQTWSITASSIDSTSLTGTSVSTGLGMSNGQGYYDFDLAVSPMDPLSVIVGTTSMFKSVDGGFNFVPIGGYMGSFHLHPDLQQIVVNDTDCYLASDGGIAYSNDFFTNISNCQIRNNNLRSGDYWGFGQGWDQDIVVGGRYHNGDAALFEDYGAGNSLALGGGEDATGHVFHGQNAVAGFRDIGTLQLPASVTGSINYSGSFTQNSIWPSDDYYGLFSSRLIVDPRYSNVYYLGRDSILWASNNYGSSYSALHNFGNGNNVWRFDIARNNCNIMYTCTTNGVYKTTDGGTTWMLLSLPVSYSYYNTDIVVNPLNDKNVYLCMASAGAANKVFESADGGTTWINITGTGCNNKSVAFLQLQGGAHGALYAVTNDRPSQVFYRDSTMSDWINFSNGLPEGLEAREGALIFYRDSKIRLCGNSSIYTSPLYTVGAPVARPMADRQRVSCSSDTVNFYDYSMYDYSGATRTWTFPGAAWVSSYTSRTPQVLYPGPGSYTVSLRITNSAGQTDTHTIPDMITFDTASICGPDTVAGLCAQLFGTNQSVNLGIVPINTNNFSISAWIQPHGLQSSFSQIVSHGLYPGSAGNGFGMGFSFSGYTPNLNLAYTDSMVTYTCYSGLICDSTIWNHVVLTYAPTGVTIYLNGVASIVNPGPMPVVDLSQSPFYLNYDAVTGQGSRYNGLVDEVKFYNYALSQDEVRTKMHLIQEPATSETGLIGYYQFNQYDATSGTLHDALGRHNGAVPTTNIVKSTCPVSTGTVYRSPFVNTAGANTFPAANVNMYLPVTGTYPDGEMVAFHLRSNPDTIPARKNVPGYFIIENYGTNTTFSTPDSLVFSALHISSGHYSPANFKIYQRSSGAFGNTWGNSIDSADNFRYFSSGSTISFDHHTGITNLFSQLDIINSDTASLGIQQPISHAADGWIISDPYPDPAVGWTRIDITAPTAGNYPVTIYLTDVAGRQLQQWTQHLTRAANSLMLSLPVLTPGNYTLTVEVAGIATVKKLVVK